MNACNYKINTLVTLQEVKDIYLFGIVGMLVLTDIVFLIPPTAVSSARLGREQKEIEDDEVSVATLITQCNMCICTFC